MKIASRAMRIALAGGLMAGAFAVGGGTPQAESAAPEPIGGCSGMLGLAGFKSSVIDPATGKGWGLTDTDDKDITVSTKGLPNPVSYGTCIIGGAAPGGDVLTITKWGSKISSPEADCVTNVDSTATPPVQEPEEDLTEWTINGKFDLTFSDLSKMSTYIRVEGFADGDPSTPEQDPADVVDLYGIVTKGVAVGAVTDSAVFFDPVIKDKTAIAVAGTGDGSVPIVGYRVSQAAALGCIDNARNSAGGHDQGFFKANILYAAIGDGTSILLGLPASGITILA